MTSMTDINAMKVAVYPMQPTPVVILNPVTGNMLGSGMDGMIKVAVKGKTITTGATSVYTTIPDTSTGVAPNAIRLASTAACYARLGTPAEAAPATVAAGTGYATGDLLAVTGGTKTVATVLTPATLKVISATGGTLGTGYAVGDVITTTGGTSSTPTKFTVTHTQLSTATLNAAGTGYAAGNVITTAGTGATASTHATINVDTTKLTSIALNAKGQNYLVNDVLTLVGGTGTGGTATVTELELKSTAVNAPGSGYIINEVITTAESAGVAAQLKVTALQVISATVVGAGTGDLVAGAGTIVEGTTGTGTKFRASVTIGATNEIASVESITISGNYTVGMTNISAEPVTYISGNTGTTLTGATLSVVMGVKAVSIQAVGTYSVPSNTFTQASTTGSGVGATFNTNVFQIKTATLTTGGAYTVNGNTFTVTGGAGTGATFNTPVYGVNTFSIVNRGDYTVEATALTQNGATVPAGGTGATFSTPLFAPKTWTVSVQGLYSISAAILTQASIVGSSGTGTTFIPSYGIVTATVSTPGEYTIDPTNPVATTSTTGSGATFNIAMITDASAGDMLIMPGDALVVDARGFDHVAAVQVDYAGILQISPIEN